MKRVLLIGGSGQLGTAIQHAWTDVEITAPSQEQLDICDAAEITTVIEAANADIVVNCAAFHDVDRCENEMTRAFEVNAFAVDRIAHVCRDRDLIFVTISTDYVFDGESTRPYREEDPARPISAYGASKLAGELLVSRLEGRSYVVRTCGLYGKANESSKPSFIDRIIQRARGGESLRVVDDVVVSPTYAGHLARALRQLVDSGRYGLYHAVNEGSVSWYDFAREALRIAGLNVSVESAASTASVVGARRPRYSALSDCKISALDIKMPDWRAGIVAYLG